MPDTNRLGATVPDAISAGIVAFAISVSMAKLFGKKNAYEVDSNQVFILISYIITYYVYYTLKLIQCLSFSQGFIFNFIFIGLFFHSMV